MITTRRAVTALSSSLFLKTLIKQEEEHRNEQVTAIMTLTACDGADDDPDMWPLVVTLTSMYAPQMKSLVHAYMVRYILPRKKEEAENKVNKF